MEEKSVLDRKDEEGHNPNLQLLAIIVLGLFAFGTLAYYGIYPMYKKVVHFRFFDTPMVFHQLKVWDKDDYMEKFEPEVEVEPESDVEFKSELPEATAIEPLEFQFRLKDAVTIKAFIEVSHNANRSLDFLIRSKVRDIVSKSDITTEKFLDDGRKNLEDDIIVSLNSDIELEGLKILEVNLIEPDYIRQAHLHKIRKATELESIRRNLLIIEAEVEARKLKAKAESELAEAHHKLNMERQKQENQINNEKAKGQVETYKILEGGIKD